MVYKNDIQLTVFRRHIFLDYLTLHLSYYLLNIYYFKFINTIYIKKTTSYLKHVKYRMQMQNFTTHTEFYLTSFITQFRKQEIKSIIVKYVKSNFKIQ